MLGYLNFCVQWHCGQLTEMTRCGLQWRAFFLAVFNTNPDIRENTAVVWNITEIEVGIISLIYMAIKDESSIFWGAIVSPIVRKKIRINMCKILNGNRKSRLNPQI